MVGQHHSTQCHSPKVVFIEQGKLHRRLLEIAAEHIRWGRLMGHSLLRREGWTLNHKQVHRLWREEELQRPIPHNQKRARPADGSVRLHQAEHPNQVLPWTSSSMPPLTGDVLISSKESTSTADCAWTSEWAGAASPKTWWRW